MWHVPYAGAWRGCTPAPARPGGWQPKPPRDKGPGGRIVGRDRAACILYGCTPGPPAPTRPCGRRWILTRTTRTRPSTRPARSSAPSRRRPAAWASATTRCSPTTRRAPPRGRRRRRPRRAHLMSVPGLARSLAERLAAASPALAGGLVRARCRGRAGVRAGAVPGDRAHPRVRLARHRILRCPPWRAFARSQRHVPAAARAACLDKQPGSPFLAEVPQGRSRERAARAGAGRCWVRWASSSPRPRPACPGAPPPTHTHTKGCLPPGTWRSRSAVCSELVWCGLLWRMPARILVPGHLCTCLQMTAVRRACFGQALARPSMSSMSQLCQRLPNGHSRAGSEQRVAGQIRAGRNWTARSAWASPCLACVT